MREMMGEDFSETQAASYVDRILTTFNMDGSFSLTDSQEDQLTWDLGTKASQEDEMPGHLQYH